MGNVASCDGLCKAMSALRELRKSELQSARLGQLIQCQQSRRLELNRQIYVPFFHFTIRHSSLSTRISGRRPSNLYCMGGIHLRRFGGEKHDVLHSASLTPPLTTYLSLLSSNDNALVRSEVSLPLQRLGLRLPDMLPPTRELRLCHSFTSID